MYLPKLTSQDQVYDVCVVGAGPSGLTVALECEAAGLSVLLVEAGREQMQIEGLGDVEILDAARHPSLEVVTRSGLGGTSSIWGGRCVPFDDVDFERRSFVPNSGWPLSHDEIKPWYRKACEYLDCGTGEFSSPAPWWNEEGVVAQSVERLSAQPRLGIRFKDRISKSRRLRVSLGYVVSALNLDDAGNSVNTISLAGGKASDSLPKARFFVLACGGLQTTRILLDLQRLSPHRFGDDGGPLGRFYMGHLTGKIASLVLNDQSNVEDFDFVRDVNGYWCRRRFSFSAKTQIEQQLLNTVFWLGNPPFHDPSHGSAAASLIYLGLALPLAGRFLSNETFAFHRGMKPSPLARHAANILKKPLEAVGSIAALVDHRLTPDNLRPFFLRNGSGRYALHYHAEQIPSPTSRVKLTPGHGNGDRLTIDFRFSQDDAHSVVRAHEILDKALRRSGKGYLEYYQRAEERLTEVLAQAIDGYHQIGTTRMSEGESSGVVDRNCRVHGLDNLFLAGSSVFPTSGQANPTFLTVALASRLAEHLRKQRAGQTVIAG
jgi:hypothetical protein